jgi:putative phosphoesterase
LVLIFVVQSFINLFIYFMFMKIAIISDIHDNLPNLKKCLSWCAENKIEKLICAGDVTNSETLQILSENFKGEIFMIAGNGETYDEDVAAAYENINYGGRFAIFKIDGKNIGVCHEPSFIADVLKSSLLSKEGLPVLSVAEGGDGSDKCDIIFYGHTHKPWIEIKNGIQIVNPGTLGGVYTPATFAVWDTTKTEPELKLLATLK